MQQISTSNEYVKRHLSSYVLKKFGLFLLIIIAKVSTKGMETWAHINNEEILLGSNLAVALKMKKNLLPLYMIILILRNVWDQDKETHSEISTVALPVYKSPEIWRQPKFPSNGE